MNAITILGFVAGTLTTISFLPQVIKTLKLKKTKDISLWMYVIICLGTLLWMAYGLVIRDVPIIAANSITIILVFILLFSKLRYG